MIDEFPWPPAGHGQNLQEERAQVAIRIGTSYFPTEVRVPGVSPAGMALSASSPGDRRGGPPARLSLPIELRASASGLVLPRTGAREAPTAQ
jgi:hypothetical protein